LYCGISWVKLNIVKFGSTDKATPYIALTAPSHNPKSVCNTKCLLIIHSSIFSVKLKNHVITDLLSIRTWLNIRVTTLFRCLLTQTASLSTQMLNINIFNTLVIDNRYHSPSERTNTFNVRSV